MPYDPRRIEETTAWLQKAQLDLRAAQADMGAEPALVGDALFHCQQAAEKAMKALLTWHDQPFRRTHDLGELGRQCVSIDGTLEPLCLRAEPLTVFATVFRYPGDPGEPPRQEAEAAMRTARAVYDAILSRLPQEARP